MVLWPSTLEPAPTNFTDLDRYRQRTLHGLYSTITHGVNGTAMKSYAKLPDNDRWALAFYVGQLAPTDLMKFEENRSCSRAASLWTESANRT